MRYIDAQGVYYKQLNELVKQAVAQGETDIVLQKVNGQRYIGAGIGAGQRITIEGTPGNDMAAYMDGAELIVKGNAQDGIANTMNDGRIIVHGHVGDTLGYAMRGGEVFVQRGVGYRVGIHMKEYQDKVPVLVIGGKAGDFLGEYMAGGILLLLGLNLEPGQELVGNYCGTGMHGGVMYIRGHVPDYKLGKEVKVLPVDEQDQTVIQTYVRRYAEYFAADADQILSGEFFKLIPFNKRPYGNLYTPH